MSPSWLPPFLMGMVVASLIFYVPVFILKMKIDAALNDMDIMRYWDLLNYMLKKHPESFFEYDKQEQENDESRDQDTVAGEAQGS